MKINLNYYDRYHKKFLETSQKHDKTDKQIKIYRDQIKIIDEKIKKQDKIINLKYHKPYDFDSGATKKFFSMFKSGSKYLITMLCQNNQISHFIVETTEKYFIFEEGLYIIVAGYGDKNRETGVIEITYKQGIALPLDIQVDSECIKDALTISDSDVDASIDPIILKRYTDGNFVEKVLKGDKLENDISLMRILTILSICVNLGVLLLVLSQVL